jgi:hypothetical protein
LEEINKINANIELGFLYEDYEVEYVFDRLFSTINTWYGNVITELVQNAHDAIWKFRFGLK